MRRPTTVELMLLTTVVLWSLNLSVTKYVLDEGVLPLTYSFVRYGLAGAIFVTLTLLVERTLRVDRRHLPVLLFTAVVLLINQLCFVFALDRTTAATIGLILGSIPIFAALFGVALGREQLSSRFWLGAGVSFVGVALVAVGSGGEVSGGYVGILLGLATCITWAAYSVAVAPLMTTYSPSRVSAVVIPGAWLLLAVTGLPQTREQEWDLGWWVWTLVVLATIGPLVLTNILWFRSIAKIGPARATLAANLQPFVAAILAVILLSEPLSALQVLGGLLIASGIFLARRRATRARLESAA
jgi:drug/metabolite transporter (DMT)-like permease